jgi:uncharacterized membrane protein YfcA
VDFNPAVALAGLLVGFTVGMTGMGGGALMTPIMILFFRVEPLAAVSSDLVVSLIMKPIGGGVHLRRGTVNKGLVGWLSLGSVPSAFAGVLLLRALGGDNVGALLKPLLGVVLLLAALSMVVKAELQRRRARAGVVGTPLVLRPALTVAIGAIGGLMVGLTSVGSGSLIIVMLLFAYPGMRASQLVGTDLVQAIPLVGAAALGHVLFGAVQLGLTLSLLVGALPGVYLGARVSAKAPDRILRPTLFVVLLSSGLKLINVV